MMVSIELVMLIVSVATTLLGLATGFGWVITRMDARFAESEQRTNLRFDKVDERFDKVDAEFDRVYAQFDRIDERFRLVDSHFDRPEASMQESRSEVGDVKISIARLEGPLPRLIVER